MNTMSDTMSDSMSEIMSDTMALENEFDLGIYPKRQLVLVEGKGATLFDIDGNQYIDCAAGHGVANIGHGNQAIIHALTRQARRLITCPGTFYNDTRAHFLQRLVEVAPQSLKEFSFVTPAPRP